MKISKLIPGALALALFASSALAQTGVTTPEGTPPATVTNSSGQNWQVLPRDIVGYDTSNGKYCVVGSSSTCTVAPSASGSSGSPPYGSTPLGYQQLTPTTSTAVTLPTGATFCIVEAEGQTLRYRDDGTAPTASVGMPIAAGGVATFGGATELAALRLIQTATGGLADVSCYR